MKMLYPLVVAAAACVALCGCSVHGEPIQPTHQVISQIGLPVYPHSRPITGTSVSQGLAAIKMNTLSVGFVSNDDFDTIVKFYASRVPKNAQRIHVPMGFADDVTFQFFSGPYQKQIVIMNIKNTRMIQLRSIQLLQTPGPSPAPSDAKG